MIPLKDHAPRVKFPFVNYGIIAATLFVFLLQLWISDFEEFVIRYGFIPAYFSFFDLSAYRYILFSIFLHGGFFHLISNIWFLLQFFSGIGSLVAFDLNQGGVAWFAHISGFITGYLLALTAKAAKIRQVD